MDRQDIKKLEEIINEPEVVTETEKNHIRLSTGVVLRKKVYSKLLLKRVHDQFPSPKPPRVFLEEKGREEENPNDPAYLEAVERHASDLGERMIDAAIIKGTEIVSVPDGFSRPEDTEWQEENAAMSIEVPQSRAMRYLFWVKYEAAPADDDMVKLLRELLSMHGVTEEAVATEMDKFPGETARSEDPQVSA